MTDRESKNISCKYQADIEAYTEYLFKLNKDISSEALLPFVT